MAEHGVAAVTEHRVKAVDVARGSKHVIIKFEVQEVKGIDIAKVAADTNIIKLFNCVTNNPVKAR